MKVAPKQVEALLKKVKNDLQVFGVLDMLGQVWLYRCSRSRTEAAKDNQTMIPWQR
jgi:hypothetical protein